MYVHTPTYILSFTRMVVSVAVDMAEKKRVLTYRTECMAGTIIKRLHVVHMAFHQILFFHVLDKYNILTSGWGLSYSSFV